MALVSTILTRVALILNDAAYTRWTTAELESWFNDGVRETVNLHRNANEKNVVVALVAGVKQAMPADAVVLIDVVGNVNADATAGKKIRPCLRQQMDTNFPKWQSDSPSLVIDNLMYDISNRKVFYVYPPALPGAKVELVHSFYPTAVTATSEIPLDAIFHTPLVDYILFRAYSKDAEVAQNAQLAASYLQLFRTAVIPTKE